MPSGGLNAMHKNLATTAARMNIEGAGPPLTTEAHVHMERLIAYLSEDDKIAAGQLARATGRPFLEVPPIVRVVEDVAILRRINHFTDLGRSRHFALTRAAEEFGMPFETLRHRVRVAQG